MPLFSFALSALFKNWSGNWEHQSDFWVVLVSCLRTSKVLSVGMWWVANYTTQVLSFCTIYWLSLSVFSQFHCICALMWSRKVFILFDRFLIDSMLGSTCEHAFCVKEVLGIFPLCLGPIWTSKDKEIKHFWISTEPGRTCLVEPVSGKNRFDRHPTEAGSTEPGRTTGLTRTMFDQESASDKNSFRGI